MEFLTTETEWDHEPFIIWFDEQLKGEFYSMEQANNMEVHLGIITTEQTDGNGIHYLPELMNWIFI